MAAGQTETPQFNFRKAFLWTEIFRTFQVALDVRKLLAAAAGILVMSLGWYVLSAIFFSKAPDAKDESRYGTKVIQDKFTGKKKPGGAEYTEADYALEAKRLYDRDKAQWDTLNSLAGPNGRLSTLPWYEYRGPNPYSFLTSLASGEPKEIRGSISGFLSGTLPVLIEPLVKLLVPVVKIVDPDCSPLTRLYLILCLAWSVATWAFFGGIITRIAAINFTGKDRTTLKQAAQYVASRYVNYVISPLFPVLVIGIVTLVMMLYAFVALVPLLGDVVMYGVGFPLVILGGIVMVVILIGLLGYPLMYCTLSVEGTDSFDALSRTYNYVYQAPWSLAWYTFLSIFYGAVVTFFVIFAGSMTVYMGKWAISQAPLSEYTNRKPDYLFIYAPESFGWKELFLKGSPLDAKTDPATGKSEYTDKVLAEDYTKSIMTTEKIAAGMTSFWLVLFFMVVVGFSYSYFWSASTMIYLLMRKKVDDIEIDELYVEEPLPTPAPIAPPAAPATTTSSLPMVPPPPPYVAPVTPPVVVPPVVPPTPVVEAPKPEEPK
jgi:hypothetical protein